MPTPRFLALCLVVSSSGLAAAGCSGDDPVDAVQNRVTCKDVCQRYAECFDGSYNVDACTERCTDDATADDEKDAKLDACDACMDDKSCLSSVFNCADDCTPFVP
jgi:hypothetical protein